MDSSESLLEILDNTPHVIPHPSDCNRVIGPPRVRKEGESEGSEGGGGGEVEGEGDERGFEYTTTANIARHLRSEHTAGGGG